MPSAIPLARQIGSAADAADTTAAPRWAWLPPIASRRCYVMPVLPGAFVLGRWPA